MKCDEFDKLCELIMNGAATPAGRRRFIAYATSLRVAVVERVDYGDDWDKEWPELAYRPWGEENEDAHNFDDDQTIEAWARKHGYQPR